MLSMAPVGSAGGAAKYFAADNYYTLEESAEESLWYGQGAELLGLAPSENGDLEAKAPTEATEADKVAEKAEVGEGQGDPTMEGAGSAEGKEEVAPDTEVTSEGPAQVVSDGPPETLAESDGAIGGDDPHKGLEAVDGSKGESLGSVGEVTANKTVLTQSPTGKVDAKVFENILNGKLPDGTQVGKAGDRRLGMDLTFSMPKSASLIAYVGGDKRVLQAHMGAVKTAMRWVEANLAETRVRDEQGRQPVRTGNLVYALFQHDTSRALDPQGHVHAVIANVTRLPNGKWQSLHNGEIWRNNTVTSSVYHAAFRGALEKLGYRIELQGKHGTFEIAGVPKAVRDAFSQRREEILAKGAQIGIATPQGLRAVTKNTRDAKINVTDRDALTQEWKARADELGWKPETVIDAARARAEQQPGLFERGLSAVEGAMREARAFITGQLRGASDPLIDRGLQKLQMSPAQARTQVAVASAIRILSEREAAFEVHQVTKTALDLGVKDVTPESITERLTEIIEKGEVVPGVTDRRDNLVTMVTTRDAIATEFAILGEIEKGKDRSEPLFLSEGAFERLTIAARDRPLNEGQMAAGISILSTSDRIMAVQGDAGTGKSSMLRPVADILKFEGRKMLGLAFQTKVAASLREETGIEATTVAQFLFDHAGALQGDKAAIAQSRAELAGSFIFLDEASMISNDQMVGLNRIANIAQVGKFMEIGDRKQLLPIEGGKSFALSQAGGIATVHMTENLRQKTPELRTAAAMSRDGQTGEALRLLSSTIHESPERNGAAAGWWLSLSPQERDTAALFTSGKQSRDEINNIVQAELRAEGTIRGEGISMRVNEAVNLTREEMRYARNYQPGLTLEVWKRDPNVGLERGEYRVTRIFDNGKVELQRGRRRLTFKPENLPAGSKDSPLKLAVVKDVRIHEGETIRWTARDRTREIHKGTIGKVLGIDQGNVTIQQPDKTVIVLQVGDPMLKRIDLAYALNMHMAQGMTADKGALVMGSEERFLANQRLAHVGLTRVRDELRTFTDDKEKLIRQINRVSGDKTSALEVTGQINIDQGSRQSPGTPTPDKPMGRAPTGDFSIISDRAQESPLDKLYPGLAPTEQSKTNPATRQLSAPEKTKGLEL
jgi:conjugative relaxase-like TrwC/TraI family protein